MSNVAAGNGCVYALLIACAWPMVSGCSSQYLAWQNMHVQPAYKTYEPSEFFPDGMSARPLVPGTVPRGYLRSDEAFYRGSSNGEYVAELPLKVDSELLYRGRQHFDIYCSVCHGRTGVGNGMIVQRGFRQPPSYHIERLRTAPPGYFYDVITNGFGAMPAYAIQIEPADRWAITAYIRVLQLSQNATFEDVPASERAKLEAKQ